MLPFAAPFRLNVPSGPVATPLPLPSTITVAPRSAPPVEASVTLPVICANETDAVAQKTPMRARWIKCLILKL